MSSKYLHASSANSTTRVFEVFECLLRWAPLTLEQVTKATGIPRTSTYRALQNLILVGWVRLQLDGHHYVPVSAFRDLAADATYSLPEIDMLTETITALGRVEKIHFDLYAPIAVGVINKIESTDKSAKPSQQPSLIFHDVCIAILATLSPERQLMHLKSYLPTATMEEREDVHNRDFHKRVMQIQKDKILFNPHRSSASFAVHGPHRPAIGVEIYPYSSNSVSREDLIRTAHKLLSSINISD